jgi:UPF0755 protein
MVMNVFKRPQGSIKFCALLFLTVFLITSLYIGLQFKSYNDFINNSKNGPYPVTFEVQEGETIDSIAQRLTEEGVIPDQQVFTLPAYKIYLKLNDFNASNIHAGKFEIPANASLQQIFSSFRDKGCNGVEVTLREGLRIEELAEELSDNFKGEEGAKFNKEQFIALAKNYIQSPGVTYDFLPPSNLEGYLFPDTYSMCADLTSREVIDVLLTNFDKKAYSPLESEIKANKYSLKEIITMASMLEREARGLDEKKMVADIILRRLDQSIPLGIDATTQYEFGYSNTQKTWWRKGVELDQVINSNHTYSTRKNTGLPPTPIANPGVDAIRAVLEPSSNPYLFYVTGQDGKMYYAKDLNTHNYNTCKYVTQTCR